MYQMKEFMDHRPMIVIISGYTIARKSSMAKPNWSEWVPISLCKEPRCFSPKESLPDLRFLVLILDVIVVLILSTHTVFTGV